MSGAGAGAVVSGFTPSGRQGFGRPVRSLVTIGGGPFSRVASATDSNPIRTRPTTAKYRRAGIAPLQQYAPPLPNHSLNPASTVGRVGPLAYACVFDPWRIVPPRASNNIDRLNRRVPDNRNLAIAGAVFLDMRQ